MEIPLATMFWISGSVCGWGWYSSPGPIDMGVLRNVKTALSDGLYVLVGDADRHSFVSEDYDPSLQSKSPKAGDVAKLVEKNAARTTILRSANRDRCIYLASAN